MVGVRDAKQFKMVCALYKLMTVSLRVSKRTGEKEFCGWCEADAAVLCEMICDVM
jgi:hypothetical protein